MADAISTRRLTKSYGGRRVVDGLNLRVPAGTVYALLGRNGAGKSTAIKMLVGLVRPDFGEITLLGEDAADFPPQTRGRVAYLAEGHPLYDWMTVGQAVAFTEAFYPAAPRGRAGQILDHFGLSGRAKIGRLSKGERAQVSLALALLGDPELLILDDPTLGLDTNVRRDFVESMVRLIQRRGRTILFSSHVLGDVERIADRIGILIDGVLRVDCPTDHFKHAVRKVVVEFGRAVPPLLPLPPCEGLVGDRQVGTRRELVFVNFGPRQRALLESLSPLRVDVEELNLEDAFIEYTRGPRRPLPSFAGEPADDSGAGNQGAA
jgi:ABC-2 type transport system ATP-binding protein